MSNATQLLLSSCATAVLLAATGHTGEAFLAMATAAACDCWRLEEKIGAFREKGARLREAGLRREIARLENEDVRRGDWWKEKP